jgi:hypothetical protein
VTVYRRDYLRTIGAASAAGGLIGIAGCAGPGGGEGEAEGGGGGDEESTGESGGGGEDSENITADIAEYNNTSGENGTGKGNETGIPDDDNESG